MTMVYLGSSSVSGGSSTSFTLPSGYDIFEFQFTDVYSNRISCCNTGLDRLTFQLNFSGVGSVYHTSTIIRAWNFNSDTTSAQVSYDNNAITDSDKDYNAPQLSYTVGSSTYFGPTATGVITVYDPFSTTSRKHYTSQTQHGHSYSSTQSTNSVFRDVYYHTTAAVSSVTFGITAPWVNQMYGDFYMYGLK